jgi:hypothetical protein
VTAQGSGEGSSASSTLRNTCRPPAEAAAEPPPTALRLDSVEKDCHNLDGTRTELESVLGIGSRGTHLICRFEALLTPFPVSRCLTSSLVVSPCASVRFGVVLHCVASPLFIAVFGSLAHASGAFHPGIRSPATDDVNALTCMLSETGLVSGSK